MHQRSPTTHPWDELEAEQRPVQDRADAPARPGTVAQGSKSWAVAVALALWLLLIAAFGLVVSVLLLVGGAEATFGDAIEDSVLMPIFGAGILGALVAGVVVGLRAERLHGWRSAGLVALGTIAAYVFLAVIGQGGATMLAGAVATLVLWSIRRRGSWPKRLRRA